MEVIHRKEPKEVIKHNNKDYVRVSDCTSFENCKSIIDNRTGKEAVVAKTNYGWAVYESTNILSPEDQRKYNELRAQGYSHGTAMNTIGGNVWG